jgi:hypothetical protein
MSKGARLRIEKKRKEADDHKKRMAALKNKRPKKAVTKPSFDRSKLSSGFMSNAKKTKDEANGWALDFDNPT